MAFTFFIVNTKVKTVCELTGCKITAIDNDSQSLLHFVTLYGNLALVEAVIKAGANVNHRTLDGQAPLHIAAIAGCTNLVFTGLLFELN